MLRYLYNRIVFSEIPEEITLGVSISGCRIHCDGCHSKELWEDRGIPLGVKEIDRLLEKNKGITCLLLLGGEHNIDTLIMLLEHASKRIKTAWYSGLDKIPENKKGILGYLDYIKLGHYDKNLGGLASNNTNQKLYEVEHIGDDIRLIDITWKLKTKKQ